MPDALIEDLLLPRHALALDEAPRHWRVTRLTFTCRRPAGADFGPWTPAALRGAMGAVLRDADPPEMQAARAIFYDPLPELRPGRRAPRPYVIGLDEAPDGRIAVTVTLFGRAEIFRDAVAAAMAAALARAVEIGDGARRMRRPWPLEDIAWSRAEAAPAPFLGDPLFLIFTTPLRLGPPSAISGRMSNLVMAIAERSLGLARWQGYELSGIDLSRLRDIADAIDFDASAMRPVPWRRHSSRQRHRTIPMAGLAGRLILRRPPPILAPLLALALTAHAGGQTSFGMGRFHIG